MLNRNAYFLSTHRSLALTEGKGHTKKLSDLKLKQGDFFRFTSVCCLAGLFNRYNSNSIVSAETAGGIFWLSLAEAERVLRIPDQPVKDTVWKETGEKLRKF